MKQLILGTTLTLCLTTQAFALSCVKPDIVGAFNDASASDKSYVVLKGTYAFTPPEPTDARKPTSVDAEFAGRLLTGKGFSEQVGANVRIDLTCTGDWCADISPDTEYVSFVENRDNTLVFEVAPCYALTFKEPAVEDVKRLENCARGGACEVATN